MKTLSKSIFILLMTSLCFSACEKGEDVEPQQAPVTNNSNNGGSNVGDSTVVEADVNGLKQNYIKADGRSEDYLYLTDIGGYSSNGEDYFTLHITGKSNHLIDLTIKGNQLREGNFSLKKYQLGSSPGLNEAVLHVSIEGNAMDFETTDGKALSIKKDENGFFVVKLAPIVGINRNNWDDVVTEPISIHVVTNHTKISMSNTDNETFDNDMYDYFSGFHSISNQPSTKVGVHPVTVLFRDYDFSTISSYPKTTYTLSTSTPSLLDLRNGTAAKGVSMGYFVGVRSWTQNYNKTQTIEMELTPKTMIISFTNIEFVNPTDASQTTTVTGKWEVAR